MLNKIPTIISISLLFSSIFLKPPFAQAPTGEILRSEEVLEKDKALREKIGEEQKLSIRKIIVNGISLIQEEDLEDIISPLQKNWLTKEDIEHLLDSIKQAYKQKGYTDEPKEISYQVTKKQLIIKVVE